MREETRKAVEAYRATSEPQKLSEEEDPYRCPVCDRKILRNPWRCVDHGPQPPYYDSRRASLVVPLDKFPCGCTWDDSGLIECDSHDPDVLIETLLDEIKYLETRKSR